MRLPASWTSGSARAVALILCKSSDVGSRLSLVFVDTRDFLFTGLYGIFPDARELAVRIDSILEVAWMWLVNIVE